LDLPTHRADVDWVECGHENTLLCHLLELNSEWEGDLCSYEPLENGADDLEGYHVGDRVEVLHKHIVHHVWVAKHVHLLVLYLLVEVALLFVAEKRLPQFYSMFGKELCILPQQLGTG